MSCYDWLVGQRFRRNGIILTIVKCNGATVLASDAASRRPEKIIVSLAEVLEALAVPEVTMTELPKPRHSITHA